MRHSKVDHSLEGSYDHSHSRSDGDGAKCRYSMIGEEHTVGREEADAMKV